MEAKDGSRAKSLLNMAKRNVGRLQRLVDQLMDFSRLEAGKLRGSYLPVPIGSLTKDLGSLFQTAVEKSKLKYTIDCEEDDGRCVYVDPDMYEKIILNLCGNAYKYTHDGFIKLELRYTPTSVVIRVSDSGVGIPAASLDMVGERFFRVPSSGRSHEGTGIGLSLTKELVRLHGGTLEVESVTAEESSNGEHGSTFTIRIPLGYQHLPANAMEDAVDGENRNMGKYARGVIDEALQWSRDRDSSNASSTGASASGDALSLNSSERTGSTLDPNTLFFTKDDIILVVDDSRDLRTYLATLFRPYVGKVYEAADGLQALQLAREVRPHIIISDVQMPGMDGYGLLQAVKSDEEIKWTPVILLTARAGEGERVEGLLGGAEVCYPSM